MTCDGTYASFSVSALNGCDYAVTGVPLVPGDANRDGRIDINDLTIVLTNFGQTGIAWSQGEFTGDGTVDINDLTIVLANFGTTVGAPGGSAAREPSCVPEPSATLLAAGGLAGLLACAWRKRK